MTAHLSQLVSSGSRWVTILVSLLKARRRFSWIGDRSGASVIIFAVALPAAVGVTGLGVEVSNWYLTQRGMQNAADAAVLAASANGGASYGAEAQAVASAYGFVNGSNNVVVTASNSAACPSGGSNCYSVNITGSAPVVLSGVLGFAGNTTVNGANRVALSASALAPGATAYCLVALAGSGTTPAIQTNGAPSANMAGCSLMSNTGATCHGHNLGADIGSAHGANSGCGVVQNSNVGLLGDPYVKLATAIPINTCSSYPQEFRLVRQRQRVRRRE